MLKYMVEHSGLIEPAKDCTIYVTVNNDLCGYIKQTKIGFSLIDSFIPEQFIERQTKKEIMKEISLRYKAKFYIVKK